jgi:hypothetical protein
MFEQAQRYAGGAFGFALAVVWSTTGFGAALLCLIGSLLGLGIVIGRQRLAGRGPLSLRGHLMRALPGPPKAPRRERRSAPRRVIRAEGGSTGVQTAESAIYGW